MAALTALGVSCCAPRPPAGERAGLAAAPPPEQGTVLITRALPPPPAGGTRISILDALGAGQGPRSAAVEVIVRADDGQTISVVQPPAGLTDGRRVAILTGGAMRLVPLGPGPGPSGLPPPGLPPLQ